MLLSFFVENAVVGEELKSEIHLSVDEVKDAQCLRTDCKQQTITALCLVLLKQLHPYISHLSPEHHQQQVTLITREPENKLSFGPTKKKSTSSPYKDQTTATVSKRYASSLKTDREPLLLSSRLLQKSGKSQQELTKQPYSNEGFMSQRLQKQKQYSSQMSPYKPLTSRIHYRQNQLQRGVSSSVLLPTRLSYKPIFNVNQLY